MISANRETLRCRGRCENAGLTVEEEVSLSWRQEAIEFLPGTGFDQGQMADANGKWPMQMANTNGI